MRIKKVILLICTLFAFVLQMQAGILSKNAEISILSSGKSDEAIYTKWGHAAIRINDPDLHIDVVFNYGIFNFKKGFIYKFVKGETDYRLDTEDFIEAKEEAHEKNADYYEQVLNLSPEEKEKVFEALIENASPENRYYRYNFFFDNCATRPRLLLNKNIDGTIGYKERKMTETFRDRIYTALKDDPWYKFGIDICLGSPTDRVMTAQESLFEPVVMKEAFDSAVIIRQGKVEPLVKATHQLDHKRNEKSDTNWANIVTPLVVFWFLFIASIGHVYYYTKTGKDDRWFYSVLFALIGLNGIIVYFLTFISVHPCVNPNFNLLWTNPLLLLFTFLPYIKKAQKITTALMATNIASNIIAISGYLWLPQRYNSAFLPIMLTEVLLCAVWIRKNRAKASQA